MGLWRKHLRIIIFCTVLIILGSWVYVYRHSFGNLYPPKTIHVKVDGEVKKPGIFKMAEGDTVRKILEKAEPISILENDDLMLDELLMNGQIIIVKNGKIF